MRKVLQRRNLSKFLSKLPTFWIRFVGFSLFLVWWLVAPIFAMSTKNTLIEVLVEGYSQLLEVMFSEIV